jgi:hypothetical protein
LFEDPLSVKITLSFIKISFVTHFRPIEEGMNLTKIGNFDEEKFPHGLYGKKIVKG